jgi:putative ABC transport system permease protein
MFDLDTWQEILITARRNKLRTGMTAAGVFWGMFMLLVMLGFGEGLEIGTRRSMGDFSTNAVYIWGQRTSIPYKGLQPGREIDYDNADNQAIVAEIDGIEHVAARNQLGGYSNGNNVTHASKTGNFSVMGDQPAYQHIQPMVFDGGRFLNDLDLRDRRKVAVIGAQVYDVLFDKGADPVGDYIKINGVYFQIIGLFHSAMPGDSGDRQESTIHIPMSTFQQVFNQGNRIGWFAITGEPQISGAQLEADVRALLSQRHAIHPEDQHAIGSNNSEKEFKKITNLFWGIRLFVWFVGIATLATGLVGVSNILLIVVRERTREIGLRRALGATPTSIVSLVILEAVVLTSLAGYVGLVTGVGVLEVSAFAIGPDNNFLGQPEVDLSVAVTAAIILVIGGAVAGLLPAHRAVSIKTVDALRAD